MKITVITVCYNSAGTIGRTLKSVREQSHHNIEHVIIDGASADETLKVIASETSSIAKIVSERDSGIYDAMNKGIRLATGEVVAFLNADDFYKDINVLARVAEVMQAEQLDAVYGDVEFFRAGRQDAIVRRYDSGQFSVNRLGWGWMPAHPALFVRRVLFERYGMFCTNYRIAGDFEFIARVFKHTELRHRHLPESFVCMQMGGVSTSGWRATLLLNREMIDACRVNAIPTNWFKILMRYPLKALEFLRSAV